MSDGAKLALAIVLLWIACVCFFVAFHPGGITVGGNPAQNPADVVRYFITLAANGNTSDSGSDQGSPVQAV
jgi:hypothetical protein